MLPWSSSHQLKFHLTYICSGSFISRVSSAPPHCCLTPSLPLPPSCHLITSPWSNCSSVTFCTPPALSQAIKWLLHFFPCSIVFASKTELASLPHLHTAWPVACMRFLGNFYFSNTGDCTTGKKMSYFVLLPPCPFPSNFFPNLFSPLLDIVAVLVWVEIISWKNWQQKNGYKPNYNIIVRIVSKATYSGTECSWFCCWWLGINEQLRSCCSFDLQIWHKVPYRCSACMVFCTNRL